MTSTRTARVALAVGFGLTLLVAWQIVGSNVDPILLGRPTKVASDGWSMLRSGELGTALGQSMRSFVPGYLLSVVVGVPLGLLLGRYRLAESTVGPYVTAAYATPLVALLPLYAVWFGVGINAKVAIIFTLTVMPITINTWRGVRSVPRSLIEVGTAFGASQRQIMGKIIVPATLPHVLTGLRLGVGRALIAMVLGEFFTAVTGLGGIIITAGDNFDTNRMFVPIILIMVLGVGLTGLLGALERKFLPWQRAVGSQV